MYRRVTLASTSVRSALNPRWATSLHSMLSVSPHCVRRLVKISSLPNFSVNGNGKMHPCRLQLKRDGTRWRTGREVKGKLANGVGSQYPSHYLGTWCIQHYCRWYAHTSTASSRLNWLPPRADLNGLVRFAERRNLFSAGVPSHFNGPLQALRLCKGRTAHRGE